MAATPVRAITFRRGDFYANNLDFGTTDVSAWTITSQIRRSPDERTILATFAVDMTDAATGTVILTLDEVDTVALPLKAVWDVQAVIAAHTFTIMGGEVTVERDVTR